MIALILSTLPGTRGNRPIESVRRVVMGFDTDNERTQRFTGSMYGVTANVALDLETRRARVELHGIPVGGSLVGSGWFRNPEGEAHEAGEVELDEEFRRQLAWRRVSIQAASLDGDTVLVFVTVPLLGAQSMELSRVT